MGETHLIFISLLSVSMLVTWLRGCHLRDSSSFVCMYLYQCILAFMVGFIMIFSCRYDCICTITIYTHHLLLVTFCSLIVLLSGLFFLFYIWQKTCDTCLSESDSFRLTWWFTHFPENNMISFFLMVERYSIVHIYHIFFIYSSVDGHLVWFHSLAIVNGAAINMGAEYFYCILPFISLDRYQESIDGSCGSSSFRFLRNLHNDFHSGGLTYIPTNNV
jgi:hypothetical protein